MILQALCEYYRRKAADPKNNMAPEGWEWKELPFLIVLDAGGNFQAIEDTREGEGNKRRAKAFLVLMGEKKTSKISANLLWDNVEYVLGANPRERNDIPERHKAFKERINRNASALRDIPPVSSVLAFLDNSPLKQIEQNSLYSELWREVLESNAFITFKVVGHGETTIFDSIKDNISLESSEQKKNVCLVSGNYDEIARLHPTIKGVFGTNTSGGSIVSFNKDPFKSYGKEQSYNAPVGKKCMFEYTTALNALLGKGSSNKSLIGDASTVFWTEKPTKTVYNIEENFSWFMADPPKDDPDRGIRAVKGLCSAMKSGHLPLFDENRFYLLGLAPNTARISIRFWRTGTVRAFGSRVLQHFDDIAIDRGPKDPEYLTVNQLLRATAFEYKMENVPPNMAEALMTSIVDGTQYPVSLFQQCMRRVRAEREITYRRAALLKGCLNRKGGTLKMSLDTTNRNIGYLLGRLFAVFEKVQESANPGLNTTIRERFYGAAASSPVTVFPQLLKLKNHHLAKMESKGLQTYYEKRIGEIMDAVDRFPSHLPMDEQAYFAVGYYHQRQDFFKKNSGKIPNNSTKA